MKGGLCIKQRCIKFLYMKGHFCKLVSLPISHGLEEEFSKVENCVKVCSPIALVMDPQPPSGLIIRCQKDKDNGHYFTHNLNPYRSHVECKSIIGYHSGALEIHR